MQALYYDGVSSWRIGPQVGSEACCCFAEDPEAMRPEHAALGRWQVWRDGGFHPAPNVAVQRDTGPEPGPEPEPPEPKTKLRPELQPEP